MADPIAFRNTISTSGCLGAKITILAHLYRLSGRFNQISRPVSEKNFTIVIPTFRQAQDKLQLGLRLNRFRIKSGMTQDNMENLNPIEDIAITDLFDPATIKDLDKKGYFGKLFNLWPKRQEEEIAFFQDKIANLSAENIPHWLPFTPDESLNAEERTRAIILNDICRIYPNYEHFINQ